MPCVHTLVAYPGLMACTTSRPYIFIHVRPSRHLPEGQRDLAGLRANIHSPQFSQTLGRLTAALQSENYKTIFANFNLNATDGATQLNQGNAVAAFLAALEAQAGRSGASEGGEDDMKVDGKDDEEPPSTS